MPSPIRPSLRLDLRAPPGRRLRPGRPLAGRRPPMGANAVAIAWEAFRGPAGHGLTGWEVTCAAAEVQPEPPDRNRGASRRGRWPEGYPPSRTTVWPPRWSSSAARAHAVMMSVLAPPEVLIAARRLAGARPHLAAVAGIVLQEDLWQLCREELESTSASTAGISAAAGSASSSGHAADRGVATRRDDPMARDRRPDRTARTPRLALTRWSPQVRVGSE